MQTLKHKFASRKVTRQSKLWWLLAVPVLLVLCLALWPRQKDLKTALAGGTPVLGTAATNLLLFISGAGVPPTFGDFLSPAGVPYDYYIEVPPGRTAITVELFDADVGQGALPIPGSPPLFDPEFNAGLDDGQGATVWNTVVTYTLTSPTGANVQTATGSVTGLTFTVPAGATVPAHNIWTPLATIPAPAPGHYRLRIAVNGGTNTNAFGIRAQDLTAGPQELNIYAESYINPGVTGTAISPVTRNFNFYPYVTGGCTNFVADWDSDDAPPFNLSQLTFTSRSGLFAQTITQLTGNQAWGTSAFAGWNNSFGAFDYGIWNLSFTYQAAIGGQGRPSNYGDLYAGILSPPPPTQLPPPSTQPIPNAYRIYLPTLANTAPVKAFVTQTSFYQSGPNPPVVGQATRFQICLEVNNPTAVPITFSSPTNVVTANVPGGMVLFGGFSPPPPAPPPPTATGPAIGGSGNIVWNPNTIAANSFARLCYFVDFTPALCPTNIALTGTGAAATTAMFFDGTGPSLGREVTVFGPLCPLTADCITAVPTPVEFAGFEARSAGGRTLLEWRTGLEADNLGFNLYREVDGQRVRLNRSLVAGSALMVGKGRQMTAGQSYSWIDDSASGGVYWLEEVSLNGERVMRGPFSPVADPRANFSRRGNSRTLGDRDLRPREQLEQFEIAGVGAQPLEAAVVESWSNAAGNGGGRTLNSSLSKQRSLAAGAAVKVSVDRTGWYRLSQAELVAAGLGADISPAYIQLYADGLEVPIKVVGGEDGSFDAEDAVEFFGTGLDTPSTDTRVYWLVAGRTAGRRIGQGGTLTLPEKDASFPSVVERRDRGLFFGALNNGDDDNFFGPVVSTTPAEQLLTVRNLAADGEATLEVSLVGFTSLSGDTDHRVSVTFNDQSAGQIEFDGQALRRATFKVPQAWLREGENKVTLVSVAGQDDVTLVDYVRLTYPRSLVAHQNGLQFTVSGRQQVRLTGFSSDRIHVFDVTAPRSVQELALTVEPDGGGFAARVSVPGSGVRRLVASADGSFGRARQLVANQPSQWAASNNRADLVMVTHGNFAASLTPLKELRESQGYQVAVVDVADVYDEFSYGAKSPAALKEFVGRAKSSWARGPRFILLVGDASLDPRDFLQQGDQDFVPTKLANTTYLESAHDDWFADFNNDAVPELAVGRLPVQSADEASLMVSKILRYEQATAEGPRRVLLVSDTNDVADFEAGSREIRSLLPSGVVLGEILRSKSDDATSRGLVVSALNEGPALINYIGHGGVDNWRGDLLTTRETGQLGGDRGLGFFLLMNCMNGIFQYPLSDSLAEGLMKSQGGAVVVWASSGFSVNPSQMAIDREITRLVVSGWGGAKMTIGEAAMKAKAATTDNDVRRTWTLFGDPTTRIR